MGCNVTIVPYDSTVEEIMAFHPDGIVLSNGPGNPEDVTPVIGLVRQLRGKLPIFGICMGHQLISLAYGAKTVKMKFGHRGGNHPVKIWRRDGSRSRARTTAMPWTSTRWPPPASG